MNNNVIHFDSFGVEHIPKEIKKFICNKNIERNIFRVQAYDSVMWYFCIRFIDYFIDYFKPKSTNIWLQYDLYIDKLNDILNEYNNAYHRTIKVKPADVKDNTYINSI